MVQLINWFMLVTGVSTIFLGGMSIYENSIYTNSPLPSVGMESKVQSEAYSDTGKTSAAVFLGLFLLRWGLIDIQSERY
jgi:hypothetical protein